MAICFYWADKGVGGVPVEYSILINNICRDVKVKLFANKDGFLLNHIKDKSLIDIYFIEDITIKDLSNLIYPEDVLVITTFHEFIYRCEIDCRILFWNVFPTTLISINKLSLFFNRRACQKMFDVMFDKSGIVFMDRTGVENAKINQISIRKKIPYFPVIVEDMPCKYTPPILLEKLLRIVYVGRAINWKVFPMLKIIKDIEKTEFVNKIQITIITDNKINFKHLLGYDSDLKIIFVENLTRSELNSYLLHNCDLYIGMGTSCLDAAKMGIPSVLADYSYSPFPDNYRYTWLYNTNGYCLADLAEKKQISPYDFYLRDLLDDIFIKGISLSTYSEKSYLYVKSKHSIENVRTLFIDYCQNTHLKTSDLRDNTPLRRKEWWLILKGLQKMFSK